MLSSGRLRLHPETVNALKRKSGPNRGLSTVWLAVAVLVVVLAVVKFS